MLDVRSFKHFQFKNDRYLTIFIGIFAFSREAKPAYC